MSPCMLIYIVAIQDPTKIWIYIHLDSERKSIKLFIRTVYHFSHTQLWVPASGYDFRQFESYFRCFCEGITGKKHCGRNKLDHSSPSWVCIPQKSLAIARDFWNTNSLGWTPFRTGAHGAFSIYLVHRISYRRGSSNLRFQLEACITTDF